MIALQLLYKKQSSLDIHASNVHSLSLIISIISLAASYSIYIYIHTISTYIVSTASHAIITNYAHVLIDSSGKAQKEVFLIVSHSFQVALFSKQSPPIFLCDLY